MKNTSRGGRKVSDRLFARRCLPDRDTDYDDLLRRTDLEDLAEVTNDGFGKLQVSATRTTTPQSSIQPATKRMRGLPPLSSKRLIWAAYDLILSRRAIRF